MSRILNQKQFNILYKEFIYRGTFNEEPDYYPRYRSRYKKLLLEYSRLAPRDSQCVLDVGGGQLALLCKLLWQDDAYAIDISGPHLNYLKSQNVETEKWNLCEDSFLYTDKFDFIFFSEVIEHLPIPGYVILNKLKRALKPGGIIICSTPNLYRLRNIVYMILGKPLFDYFRMPSESSLGHVLEYSREHLQWQFDKAGYKEWRIKYCQIYHWPKNVLFRLMYLIGSPLFLIPRLRDNLVAIAKAP